MVSRVVLSAAGEQERLEYAAARKALQEINGMGLTAASKHLVEAMRPVLWLRKQKEIDALAETGPGNLSVTGAG